MAGLPGAAVAALTPAPVRPAVPQSAWRVWLRRPAAGWLAAGLGTFLTTGVVAAVLHLVRIPNISLLYLFPVVAVAGVWGRRPAVGAAVLAFLSFDWFFVQPLHTFTVDDPAEWLALFVLLLAAIFTANLTAALRQQAQEAQQRAWEAGTLRALTATLAAARDVPTLLTLGREQATALFPCVRCTIERGGAVPLPAEDGELVLPLRTPRGLLGALHLQGLQEAATGDYDAGPLLPAFAAQLALALERASLLEEATQAEVLHRTEELRATLLSAVSHDLRTPLAAIKAAATSLLQRDVAWSDEERADFARSINSGADRLDRLVTNLLDLSRIEAGALRLNLQDYLLEDLVGEAVAQVRTLFAPEQLRVAWPADPAALPWVRVDPILCEQVLANLLENAAKYSSPGAPVTVETRVGAGEVVLTVADRGPGIAPAERERVFDRFYRVLHYGRAAGAGVGLAVCKGIVEAHGGRIWVEEQEGGGAVFSFTLPVFVPPAAGSAG